MIQFSQMQAAFNAATSITQVAKLIGEVRDRLEIVHTSDFANFLNHMFPILRDLIVTKTIPQYEDNDENRVRHCLLEMFNKFPNNEALKPYVYEVMTLSLKVLAEDNEDNAIIALKVIFDLHKSFRASLEQYIIPFLETVSRIYNNMPAASRAIYASAAAPTEQTPPSSLDATPTITLVKSVESFKVLTECPIIVMLLLQFYPRFVSKTMNQMVPVMLNTLSLSPSIATDTVVSQPLQRQRYREFLAAQVKTLSFLTFLLRSYSEFLKPFEPSIVKSVLMLLQRCPEESVNTRKELLIATRHILATDFRRGFVPHLDDLLEESLFLGPGQPTVLRPVAYNTMGDLVHHMKDTLSLIQIVKVVHMFALTMQDLTLPVGLHVSVARVLFALVERLQHADLREDVDSISSVRYLLHHIFRTVVDKLGVLRLHVEETFDLEERVKENAAYLQEKHEISCNHSTNITKESCIQCTRRSSRAAAMHLPNTSALYLFREDPAVQEQTLRDVTVLVQIIMGGMEGCCRAIQTVDHTARILLRQTMPSTSTPCPPDRILAFSIAQMPVVKDHVVALVSLFQYAVDCGAYFLDDYNDRLFFCQGGNQCCPPSSSFHTSRNDRTLLQKEEVLPESFSDYTKRCCPPKPGGEKEKLISCSAEATKYIATVATPFSSLDPKILAQVLNPVMASFIVLGPSSCSSTGNYFFTAVIEMLLLSYTSSVSLVVLETVFSTVIRSVSEYRVGGMSWMCAESITQRGQFAFENKNALRQIFASALQSLQRFVGNDFALACNLKLMIGQMLRVASLLPLRELRNSNCLHFLQLLLKVVNSKHLPLSLLAFRSLFSTVLHCLSGLLTRTDSSLDSIVRREVLGLICSLPVDVDSLSPHLSVMLHHVQSALHLKGQVVGNLYREALVMFESCADILSLDTITIALASNPGIAEGLFLELSRHLIPKPYPLGDIACRIMGKLGCCHAFFNASYCQNPNIDNKLSRDAEIIHVTINGEVFSPDSKPTAACGVVQLGMDNLILNACEVFESSMYASNISSRVSPLVNEREAVDSKEESSSHPHQVGKDNETPFRNKRKFMTPNSVHSSVEEECCERRNTETWEARSGEKNLDLSKPCLDVLYVQKENTTIVEAFQIESRLAAFCIIVEGLSSLMNPISIKNVTRDNLNYEGESMSCKQLLSHRSLFRRVLFTIHSTFIDPCLAQRALMIVRNAYSLIITSFRDQMSSCQLIESTLDAVSDIIFRSLLERRTIDENVDFRVELSYRPLVEWLRAISVSNLIKCKGVEVDVGVVSDADGKYVVRNGDKEIEGGCYAINIEDPLISRLTLRCFLTCRSKNLAERFSAIHTLHALSVLLPKAWLIAKVNAIVRSILSVLEFQSSLFSLCRVEEALQTLRYTINSYISATQSAPNICIVESNETNESCSIKMEDESETERTKYMENSRREEELKRNGVSTELMHMLVSALFHLSPLVQLGARETLRAISIALKLNISSVLLPVTDFVIRVIEEKLRISCINEESRGPLDQSSISGLIFCFSLDNPVIMTNENMMKALTTVLGATEHEEICCPPCPPMETVDVLSFLILTDLDYQKGEAEYRNCPSFDSPMVNVEFLTARRSSSLPLKLDLAMIRRLLFTSLVRAFCIAAKSSAIVATTVLAVENKDLLQRCFILLFKSLSSSSELINISSQKSLQLLIGLKTGGRPCITGQNYESLFPGDLLNQCLKPILAPLSASQYRQLSPTAIRGIASVFKLVGDQNYLHYRDKILKHLSLFMDPEHLVSLKLFGSEEGVEERIASGLLGLFSLLPIPASESIGLLVAVTEKESAFDPFSSKDASSSLAFISTVATLVIDLDMAWRQQFRASSTPSPFLPPFARFLSRFPEDALLFFFSEENIVNHEMFELLLRVLDLSCEDSQQLGLKLASKGSMTLLCSICFSSVSNGREDGGCGTEKIPLVTADTMLMPGSLTLAPISESFSISPLMSQENASCKDEIAFETKVETGSASLAPTQAGSAPIETGKGTGDEATEQLNAVLSYNALRLIHRLSQNSNFLCVLFDNPSLLSTLRHMVAVCLAKNEGSNRKHILLTSLLSFSSHSLHQRATVTMENNYRDAHQLKLLCDIIIQYCRLYNPDAVSSISIVSSQNFELMSFSLLPVLTMKQCIIDFTFLLDFFKLEIPILCSSSSAKRQILWKLLNMVAGKLGGGGGVASVALKVKLLQVVVLPLLIEIFYSKNIEVNSEEKKSDQHMGRQNSTDSSDVGSSSSKSSAIVHIFDVDMIQLIMQDVVGMTSHGMSGGGLVRINSQDSEGKIDRDGKDACTKDGRGRDGLEGKELASCGSSGFSKSLEIDSERNGNEIERKSSKEVVAISEKDAIEGNMDTCNLKIELLKISTLFLEHLFPLFKLFKKDIIKFAWSHIKAEDSTTRHWAYINICRFVASFDSPPKIIIQVYVALLRLYQLDGRELIRRALDTLVPVLPIRLLPEDFNKVVKWTKKILVDEGYSMLQLSHIWHVIIRFSDIFYSHRSQLVPQILNSITRIGLPTNAAPEFRLVAVAIADLVISWEIRSYNPQKGQGPAASTSHGDSSIASLLLPSPPVPFSRKRLNSDDGSALTSPSGKVQKSEMTETVHTKSIKELKTEGDLKTESEINFKTESVGPQEQIIDMIAITSTNVLSRNEPLQSTMMEESGPGPARGRSGSERERDSNREREKEREGGGADEAYAMPRALVQILANFVMRLCLLAADPKQKDAAVSCLSPRCLRLFHKLSALSTIEAVPMPYFERLLQIALESFNAHLQSSSNLPAGGALNASSPPTGQRPNTSSSSNYRNTNSTSSSVGFSDIMLSSFLDIATSSLTYKGGPNKLFEQNAYLLKDIYTPVFASESPKVHDCYRSFLKTVLTVYPCSLSVSTPLEVSGFFNKLVGDISQGLKVKVSCLKEAEALLQLLQTVCVVCTAQSRLVENFGSALLRISHVMLGDHVHGAVGRTNRRRRSRTGYSGIVYDTPIREFYEDSCLVSSLKNNLNCGAVSPSNSTERERGKGASIDNMEKEKSKVTKGKEEMDGSRSSSSTSSPLEELSGKILTCCLFVLFRSLELGCLEQQKPVIVSLLATATEGADNMLLVNLASSFCLKWVGHSNSPLSLGEQVVVFSRICTHSMRLQDDCKQAVLARFAAVSERIGRLASNSSGHQQIVTRNTFSSSGNNLGSLALFSPVTERRRHCQQRLMDGWGPSIFEKLIGLFSLDFTPQFHNQWPSIIVSLALGSRQGNTTSSTLGLPHVEMNHEGVWLQAVSDFTLSHPEVGQEICVSLLQSMWTEIDARQRDQLVLALSNNILQARHTPSVSAMVDISHTSSPCRKSRTIPFQVLEIFSKLVPTPSFPVEFLSCMGSYGCEGLVAALLEAMIGSSRGNRELKRCRTALLASLDRLEDQDMANALLRSCSSGGATDVAISLETYNRTDLAHNVILQAVSSCPKKSLDVRQANDRILIMASDRNDIKISTPNSISSFMDVEGVIEALTVITDTSRDDSSQLSQQSQSTQHMALRQREYEESNDMEVWECKWIQYAKELSQWSVLSTFASETGASDLSLESALMLGDWEGAREIRGAPSMTAFLLMRVGDGNGSGLKMRLFDGMLSLIKGNYQEATEVFSDATQMALCRWQQLPDINSGPLCHRTLLSSMQQLLELDESRNMLLSAQQHTSASRMLPDLSDRMGVWRGRLPDTAEGMLRWDSLLLWRSNLFEAITRMFKGMHDNSRLLALCDTPWTTLQLVGAARRHGLKEVGLRISLSLPTCGTMNVTEAFSKVREQVLLCLSSGDTLAGALNIVNTTNLDFFDPEQRAEIFRLKGICNSRMGQSGEAQDCFSQSVQVGRGKRGKDWLSWSHLCYCLWEVEAENLGESKRKDGVRTEADPSLKGPGVFLNDHAISSLVSLLNAVECDSAPSRMLLPRAIWMLEHAFCLLSCSDTEEIKQAEQMLECFSSQAVTMPAWTWLDHIPSLLGFLIRPGGECLIPLVEVMIIKHPQALIGHLLTKADLNSAAGATYTASTSNKLEVIRQLAKCSRGSSALWLQMCRFSDVIRRFSEPGPLEVMLNGLESVCKCSMTLEDVEDVDSNLILVRDESEEEQRKETLVNDVRSCLALLKTEDGLIECLLDTQTSCSSLDAAANADAVMWRSLRAEMEIILGGKDKRIVMVEIGGFQGGPSPSFYKILSQLQKWCWKLSVYLRDGAVPNDSSDGLDYFVESGERILPHSSFYNYFNERETEGNSDNGTSSLDMPGQYGGSMPKTGNLIKVIRVSKGENSGMGVGVSIRDLKTQSRISRSIQLLGSDGETYSFLRNDVAQSLEGGIQCRLDRLSSAIDWALQQHLPSRRRGLTIQAPKVVCLGGGVTLLEGSKIRRMCSVQQVHLDYCAESYENPHWLSVRAHEYLTSREGGRCEHDNEDKNSLFADSRIEGSLSQRKRRIYGAGCSLIPSTLLRDLFTSSSMSLSDAFIARRQFASQLGIHAAVQFLLSSAPLCPHQLLLCPHTGKIVNLGVTPSYNSTDATDNGRREGYEVGQIRSLKKDHVVPFRLTRNIVGAISGSMLLGGTTVSIGCSTDAYIANKDVLKASLSLLLCDDIRDRQGQGVGLSLTDIKTMVDGTFTEMEKIAPSTQIKIDFEEKLGGKAGIERRGIVNPTCILPLPVDIKIQNLLKKSLDEENISKFNDVTWLPWM